MNLNNRDQVDQDLENDRELEREFSYEQMHGGRRHFPGSDWGTSSEFGLNFIHPFQFKKFNPAKFHEELDSDNSLSRGV